MVSKVENIMDNPSLEELLALKRIELVDWASQFRVSIEECFKKQQILHEIIVNFVDNEVLEVSKAVKMKQTESQM